MNGVTQHPLLVFGLSLVALWISALAGLLIRNRWPLVEATSRDDFNVVQAATLTLLGLIIGFSFSMAINRYDQRKIYEEGEANAIGTEFARADLLPAVDGAKLQALLRSYLDQRILFYEAPHEQDLVQIHAVTARLQAELWSTVRAPAAAQPSPVLALAVGGMNDVLNAEGYAQAAWWNTIPPAAWALMTIIAVFCNLLIGYGSRSTKAGGKFLLIQPLVVAIAFALIADIDAPRHGFIRVAPQNLNSLAESLRAH
jgi:hypothetical protein